MRSSLLVCPGITFPAGGREGPSETASARGNSRGTLDRTSLRGGRRRVCGPITFAKLIFYEQVRGACRLGPPFIAAFYSDRLIEGRRRFFDGLSFPAAVIRLSFIPSVTRLMHIQRW